MIEIIENCQTKSIAIMQTNKDESHLLGPLYLQMLPSKIRKGNTVPQYSPQRSISRLNWVW